MNWIELNLPYYVRVEKKHIPLPVLDYRRVEVFGPRPPIDHIPSKILYEIYALERKVYTPKPGELGNHPNVIAALKKYAEEENPPHKEAMLSLVAYREYNGKVNAWYEEQPEIIEWNALCNEEKLRAATEESKLSFVGMGLNKPGVLIEVEDDLGKVNTFLLGDVDIYNNSCGCGGGIISDTSIVKRYCVVYSPKENNE